MRKIAGALVATLLSAGALIAGAGTASAAIHQCWGFVSGGGKYCVDATARVNIRTGPSTGHGIVGVLDAGQEVWLGCYRHGQSIGGNTVWYYVGTTFMNSWENAEGFVSGQYLATGADPHIVTRPC